MTRRSARVAALSPILFALAFGAYAQDSGHATHPMPAATSETGAPADAAAEMHEGMMVEPTGDADVDFVRAMIPHHQSAVTMAKVVLEHGKDPEIRKLAEDVIAAQEGEIAVMKKWLEDHGQPVE